MDIGTIIAGLHALGSLFNQPVPMTPAQVEEKPKKTQLPINTFVILPNQTPPMGIGVPPAFPLADLLSTRPLLPNMSQMVPQQPMFFSPSLAELYNLYFSTRR